MTATAQRIPRFSHGRRIKPVMAVFRLVCPGLERPPDD
jgi:hypothetical protein